MRIIARVECPEEIEGVTFTVTLIRVAPIEELSGVDVFELMVNARHVAGDYWIFEGCLPEGLNSSLSFDIVAESETGGLPTSDEGLVAHAEEIFSVSLVDEPPAWKILEGFGR